MKRNIGHFGENLSLSYLKSKGYQLISRNWYCRYSEFDLVMKKDSKTVFVEVKTMKDDSFTTPERLFSKKKIKKLLKAIQIYKNRFNIGDFRLDLVAIVYGKSFSINHYENVLLDFF